jgi:hypothetical protein
MMPVRTIAGFVAAFPSEREADDSPPGRFLAEFIATQLRTEGFSLLGPSERQGWAWDISATVDGIVISSIVGLVDDTESTPPRQWLITNDPIVSIWSCLFGSQTQRDQRELAMRRYCEIIHKNMASDDRFSHILWYNKETFDRPGDFPGTTP